jgi:hypothetical protein
MDERDRWLALLVPSQWDGRRLPRRFREEKRRRQARVVIEERFGIATMIWNPAMSTKGEDKNFYSKKEQRENVEGLLLLDVE